MGILRGITIGQHYPVDSLLHRLDPRTKILGTMVYLVALLGANDPLPFLAVAAVTVFLCTISHIPWRLLSNGLRPLRYIIIFTFVLHLFVTPGGTLLGQLGRLAVYSGGVWRGAQLAFRLVLMILTTSLLTLTTSPIVLTDGLERLLAIFKPLGLPAHELAMMMTIALRFIPILIEEADKISKAQIARGADLESGSLLQRLQSMLPILVPLFISALRRADELAIAMEARCYRGGEGRSQYIELSFSRADKVALLLLSLGLVATLGNMLWSWFSNGV